MKGFISTTREWASGDVVTASIELRIHYLYSPGRAAKTSGPPEKCYPEDPVEIEFDFVQCETANGWVNVKPGDIVVGGAAATTLFGVQPDIGCNVTGDEMIEWANEYLAEHHDEVDEDQS